ncbi:transmembrane protease serine 11D-like [Ruditapes philippinarum]|uniref:transmembrane protease serine 11D-like n=1 Tax=Ruditapes philippinarum TaxID=129788 RepID=UPI00295B9647|nr:transmembrane protease serine 11D-like [Ruditapes philippinarum]XP_060568258.1 transmembrane protease serine 11D-like [Ruditapes philippinarum]
MIQLNKQFAWTVVLGVTLICCEGVLAALKDSKPVDISRNSNFTSGNASKESLRKDVVPHTILSKVYTEWSSWGTCSKGCQQSRKRRCKKEAQCGRSYIKEKRKCKSKGTCSKRSKRKYVKLLGLRKSDKLVKQILYKILYSAWTPWTVCSRSCKKQRYRKCIQPAMCGASFIQEERQCKRSSLVCRKQYILRTFVPDDDDDDPDDAVKKIQNITKTFISNSTSDKLGPKGSDGKMKSNSPILKNLTMSCGLQPKVTSRSYRVVGGEVVGKHEWPWQVAILKASEQFCGGTLIAPQWVVTAAHCIRKNKRRRRIKVKVGEHDIYAKDDGEMFMKLQKDIPHPKYDYDTITNDIALLKLEKPVPASKTIGYACLPEETDKLPEKHMCYIIGWGKEKNTDVFGSTVLREARVPLVNRRTCQRAFNYPIHDTQVCAGSKNGGVDSCAGDSGGPLLCPKKGSDGVTRWMVYGVTSYGEGCGEKKKFGIYTKVRKYLDWINEEISRNT